MRLLRLTFHPLISLHYANHPKPLSHLDETNAPERFGECIGELVLSSNMIYLHLFLLHAISHKVKLDINVFT